VIFGQGFLPLALDNSISNCRAAVLVLVHPGYFISLVPTISGERSRLKRIKNEHIKDIMGLKEKPDIIHFIERKRLQWYGHVKRMQEERLQK
jgi:competence transcription factor ComK